MVQDVADDTAYVPKLQCDEPINSQSPDCDSTIHNIFTTTNTRCTASMACPPSSKPIGVRSNHYFNAGIAVGDQGVIVRTMDGGYTWDCVHGCAMPRSANAPELFSVSTNVRMGGFGYTNFRSFWANPRGVVCTVGGKYR